jgi:hypothetical protein
VRYHGSDHAREGGSPGAYDAIANALDRLPGDAAPSSHARLVAFATAPRTLYEGSLRELAGFSLGTQASFGGQLVPDLGNGLDAALAAIGKQPLVGHRFLIVIMSSSAVAQGLDAMALRKRLEKLRVELFQIVIGDSADTVPVLTSQDRIKRMTSFEGLTSVITEIAGRINDDTVLEFDVPGELVAPRADATLYTTAKDSFDIELDLGQTVFEVDVGQR